MNLHGVFAHCLALYIPKSVLKTQPVQSTQTPKRNNAASAKYSHATAFLRSATGKALTIVRAGLALTLISLPKAMRLPALVAGLWRVLIRQTPGILNLPVDLTSLWMSSASESRALAISDFFFSHATARASAMPPLDMANLPFMAFFMAFIAFLAIVRLNYSSTEQELKNG